MSEWYTKLKPYWDRYSLNASWQIVLPHQCDEWIIGTRDDARRFIDDLERLLELPDPPDGKYRWSPLQCDGTGQG